MDGKPPVRFGSPMWAAERKFREAQIAAHVFAKQAGGPDANLSSEIEARRLAAVCDMLQAYLSPENFDEHNRVIQLVPGEIMNLVLCSLRSLSNNEMPPWLEAAAPKVRTTPILIRQCYQAMAVYVRAAEGPRLGDGLDRSKPRGCLAVALSDPRPKDTVAKVYGVARRQRVNAILRLPEVEGIDPFADRSSLPVVAMADAILHDMELHGRMYRELTTGGKARQAGPRTIPWGRWRNKIAGD